MLLQTLVAESVSREIERKHFEEYRRRSPGIRQRIRRK
jgi:hypothetical protein